MSGKGILNLINLTANKGADYDVYIGRSSYCRTFWGNYFIIGVHGSRNQVIAKYEHQLLKRIRERQVTYGDFHRLIGKVLACHCVPKRCHGEVIAFYVKLSAMHDSAEFYAICDTRLNSNTTGGFDKWN